MVDVTQVEITGLEATPDVVQPGGCSNVTWDLMFSEAFEQSLESGVNDPDVEQTSFGDYGVQVRYELLIDGEPLDTWTNLYTRDYKFRYRVNLPDVETQIDVTVRAFGANSGNQLFEGSGLIQNFDVSEAGATCEDTGPIREENPKSDATDPGGDTSDLFERIIDALTGGGGGLFGNVPWWVLVLAILLVLLLILLIVGNLVG